MIPMNSDIGERSRCISGRHIRHTYLASTVAEEERAMYFLGNVAALEAPSILFPLVHQLF